MVKRPRSPAAIAAAAAEVDQPRPRSRDKVAAGICNQSKHGNDHNRYSSQPGSCSLGVIADYQAISIPMFSGELLIPLRPQNSCLPINASRD